MPITILRAILRSKAAALLGALLLVQTPDAATACTMDNVASLLADGVPAMRTTSMPPAATPWAPFTLAQVLAAGAPVRLAEAPADLARTFPPAVRAAPSGVTWPVNGMLVAGMLVLLLRRSRAPSSAAPVPPCGPPGSGPVV